MNFSLPPEITFKQQTLESGIAYLFRHQTLGELGRIVVLQDIPGGLCHISSEVAGDPADPITDTRLKLFKPLSEKLTAALEAGLAARGGGPSIEIDPALAPPTPGSDEIVESNLIPCDRCGEIAAHLVFAHEAEDVGGLEDYARKMYSKIRELNVPTWIIGPPLGIAGHDTPSLVMKVWPERLPVQTMTPNCFNADLDALLERHC
ncbi:MAG: hypothetical protein AAGC93_19020 [Cyanobacteria bacterium P01_F01_bin.53]